MEKEFKVIVPDGYDIDKENSTFECIKFKPIEKKLPKTWEEYCEMHDVQIGESWINAHSHVAEINYTRPRDSENDKNLLPNIIYSKAMLALCQLIQLRDYYNDGWTPDYNNLSFYKYCIDVALNKINCTTNVVNQRILAFKTAELRDEFAKNFKDLIEIAKPLL